MPIAESWTIRSGGVRAVVGARGGGIRELTVDGATVIADAAAGEVPAAFDGLILAPWPNRITDGRWTWRGAPQQLAVSEPATSSAVHGLVAWSAWRAGRVDGDAVEVLVDVLPQPGYPFRLEIGVTWTVVADGLRCRMRALNLGDADAPFGIATHPYVGVPGASVDDLVMTVPASSWTEVDANLHPVAVHGVEGGPNDFRTGAPLADVRLDMAFSDRIDAAPARITGPAGTVEMWADASFGWWQVYTSDYFPEESPRRRSTVALEPMTCGPDAFNSGRDVVVLAPGQEWSGEWGVRYLPSDSA